MSRSANHRRGEPARERRTGKTSPKVRLSRRPAAPEALTESEVRERTAMLDAEVNMLREKLAATEAQLRRTNAEKGKRMASDGWSHVHRIDKQTDGARVDTKTEREREVNYDARVWRTSRLRPAAAAEVEKLLTAFIPEGFHVRIELGKLVVDPNGTSRTWPVVATLCDRNPEGSDAHIFVSAETIDGARAKLLAIIIDGGGFFPMT